MKKCLYAIVGLLYSLGSYAQESSSAYTSVPIEAPGASDSDDAPSILDRYADDDNELDFTDDRLVIEEAIRDFSPREREVIELRFV